MERDDTKRPAEPSSGPDYGSPPGADPGAPLYGTSDSVTPIDHRVSDYDPSAEVKKVEQRRLATKTAAREEARAARAAMLEKRVASGQAATRERGEEWVKAGAGSTRGMNRAERLAGLKAFNLDRQQKRQAEEQSRQIGRRRFSRYAAGLLIVGLVIGGLATWGAADQLFLGKQSTVSDGVDWKDYPGIYPDAANESPRPASQEQAIAEGTAILAEVRAALPSDDGSGWSVFGADRIEHRSNGWGGSSLMNDYVSGDWYTPQPIGDLGAKKSYVDAVTGILRSHGFENISLENDPTQSASGDDRLNDLFGGTALETQVVWKLTGYKYDGPLARFELEITDFSRDVAGEFATRAARAEASGDIPVNAIRTNITGSELLPDGDRAEFRERVAPFDGKQAAPYPE